MGAKVGCTKKEATLSKSFDPAHNDDGGGGGGGGGSPFGLGLGNTLHEAFSAGNPLGQSELKTEDTQQGSNQIFGASEGDKESKGLLDGLAGRSDPVSAGSSNDWNTELNMNAPNAIIVPPSDINAPPKPISSMIGGGVMPSDFTTNQGGGQYVPQTLTAPDFIK